MTELTELFGANSPLKEYLPGFQPRAGQAWMAEAVAEALAASDRLVVEAGTGTGKTFAYLLPALLSVARLAIRTVFEDRLLREELEGYADYAARVRYRLIPALW